MRYVPANLDNREYFLIDTVSRITSLRYAELISEQDHLAALSKYQINSKLWMRKTIEAYASKIKTCRYDAYWFGLGPLYLLDLGFDFEGLELNSDCVNAIRALLPSAQGGFKEGDALHNLNFNCDLYVNTSGEHFYKEDFEHLCSALAASNTKYVLLQFSDLPADDHLVSKKELDELMQSVEKIFDGWTTLDKDGLYVAEVQATRYQLFFRRD